MQAIKRKRVTRVGSGAFSIYLPKKWIDGWTPEQQEDRQVDLHQIGQGLLILPVITDDSFEAAIEPTKKAVRRWVLSTYLRGAQQVTLTPATGTFDNEAIAAGRDFIRHLDERLIASSGPDAISFRLNRDLPPPAATGQDILNVMAAKLQEMLDLTEQAVAAYGLDPDRCLHALGMLQSIYEEDVSRYFHQAMRMVATLELPLETVTDFQVLDLVAADLHRMADHLLRMAGSILAAYGLELEDLAYPRDHLMSRIREQPIAGVARQIIHTYPKGFTDARELFTELSAAFASTDIPAMAELIGRSYDAQNRLQQRIFQTVIDNWGEGDIDDPAAAAAGFVAYQLSVPLTDFMGAIAVTARHGLGLLTAAPGAKQ